MNNIIKFVYDLFILKIEHKLNSKSNKNINLCLNIYEICSKLNDLIIVTVEIELNCVVFISEQQIVNVNRSFYSKIELLEIIINKLKIKLDNNDLNKINILKRQCAFLMNPSENYLS